MAARRYHGRAGHGRPMVAVATAIAALSLASMLGHQHAAAELLSSRPITVVIPFTPGASSDTFQRLVAKKVTENTGQSILVESRPGGGGTVAATSVKRALPDGYTLFQANRSEEHTSELQSHVNLVCRLLL